MLLFCLLCFMAYKCSCLLQLKRKKKERERERKSFDTYPMQVVQCSSWYITATLKPWQPQCNSTAKSITVLSCLLKRALDKMQSYTLKKPSSGFQNYFLDSSGKSSSLAELMGDKSQTENRILVIQSPLWASFLTAGKGLLIPAYISIIGKYSLSHLSEKDAQDEERWCSFFITCISFLTEFEEHLHHLTLFHEWMALTFKKI